MPHFGYNVVQIGKFSKNNLHIIETFFIHLTDKNLSERATTMKLASIIRKISIVLGLLLTLTVSENLLKPCFATSTTSEVKSEICAIRCELECSDINIPATNYQVNSPLSQCLKNFQKSSFKSASSFDGERKSFDKKLSCLELTDYNYRGQFCSANLLHAICHLLI